MTEFRLRWKKVKAAKSYLTSTHSGIIVIANQISTAMTNNPLFANAPAALATIPSLVASIQLYLPNGELTINQSISNLIALSIYEDRLFSALDILVEYVNNLANTAQDSTIVLSAGMELEPDTPELRSPFSKHI